MRVADLMLDLARLGIRIEAHGDRLRFASVAATKIGALSLGDGILCGSQSQGG